MKLILTFDYELFGDGSGNIFEHIINPTKSILHICKKHNVKTTLFFEVVEYWAIKEQWLSGNNMGYTEDPILAIENQLIQAHNEGHDIQLHFHPQWLNAVFKDGEWKLDFENWRLGDYTNVKGYDRQTLLNKGKATIEEIIQKIDPEYSSSIIRAGGYNIMPSKSIGKAMIQTNLIIDSSVFPGGIENGPLSVYDYTKTSIDLDYWFASVEDISRPSDHNKEILEIPIFALPQRRWKKIGWERIKSMMVNKKSAVKTLSNKTANKTLFRKITYWLEKEALTWDFCLFSRSMHDKFFNYIESHLKNKRSHFVLIGHPKNFTSEKTLEYLISEAKIKNYSFLTLSEYARTIYN